MYEPSVVGAGSVWRNVGNVLVEMTLPMVRDTEAPSVVAKSTSELSSPMSRRTCTPEARSVSPPLFLRRIRRSCSFSRARSDATDGCSPSDESDERSNEGSTGSIVDRRAFRTSCWADDSALCCVDGCDRAYCAARRQAAKLRRGVESTKH